MEKNNLVKNSKETKQTSSSKFKTQFREYVPGFIIILIIFQTLIINCVVPSESMESTIMTGSRIIGNRLSYKFNEPEYGDIVIFKDPDFKYRYLIKRLIGKPGDTIEIKQDGDHMVVARNGETLDEPYLNEPMQIESELTFHVSNDSYFFMGDNRNHSYDSRYQKHHFVHRNQLVAKAIFQYQKGFQTFI